MGGIMRKLLLLVLIFLVGCTPPITEGEIYSKQYHQAWDEKVYAPIVVGETTIPHWRTDHHPEKWSIDIQNDYDEENDQWQTRRVWVDESYYNKLEVGGWMELE
jgi:hypothetical protein